MIGYSIFIKDNMEGYEFIYESYEELNDAIEAHKKITQNKNFLKGILMDDLLALPIHIDQYHLDNPFKRFDVTLEVDYD